MMSYTEKQVTCTKCSKRFTAVPKVTFCGFEKFQCPHCRETIFYPLIRKSLYWIISSTIGGILFFVGLSLLEVDWGDRLLLYLAALPIDIDEKKGLILWPLLVWSLVRLGGMYSKKVLAVSRKILYGTGILAFLAFILALFGFVAGAVRIGIVLPPLIGAFFLLCFMIYIWVRNISIIQKTRESAR